MKKIAIKTLSEELTEAVRKVLKKNKTVLTKKNEKVVGKSIKRIVKKTDKQINKLLKVK